MIVCKCEFETAAVITNQYTISRRCGEFGKSIHELKQPAIVLGSLIFIILPTDLLKGRTKSKTLDQMYI